MSLVLALALLASGVGAEGIIDAAPEPTGPVTAGVTAKLWTVVPSRARVVLKPRSLLRGTATWYCQPGRSACAVGWRWDGPYAAAGPGLRRALGPNWRGRWVTVASGGRAIRVRLIDWCACPFGNRLIDLYARQMVRLAGSTGPGEIGVSISW